MTNIFAQPAYVGIILEQDQSVFLIQRQKTDWMAGYWNFPGGLLEKNESLKEAAIRETKEEVGVAVRPEDFELVHVIHVHKSTTNTQDIIGFYFRANHWQGVPSNNEPEKIIDAQWFSINDIPPNTTDHAELAIKGLIARRYYSESGRE